MLVFKPCENFLPLLLLPPKTFTTTINSKPHLLLLHLHLHHHHDVKLHCSPPIKAHFKSITLSSSSSSPLSPPPPPPPPPPQPSDSAGSSSSSSLPIVDFLMDSGGLSYVEAIQVIREKPSLLLDEGSKPRSVIAYFESIGFSKTHHISKLILKYPNVLVADVEQTLKPKIQLFLDFGFTKSDLADLIASKPRILHQNLENHIKPVLELIKSFVQTDRGLVKIIKRYGVLIGFTYNRNFLEANIHVLREQHGIPDSEILYLISTRPSVLMISPKVFKSIVERIASHGFEPETRMFLTAVTVMSGMSKPNWDSKIDLLKGLGWSEFQIINAFRRSPRFLTLSGEKLKERIEFFKESLNWDASFLSQHPIVLNFSFKKRVIPRFAIFKCLISKEIIKDDKRFKYMLELTETQFLSKYVFKYHLYEVYEKECILGCEEEEDNGEITNQQDHGD